ncbi:hypothetical protein ACWENS_12900 [Streptomyces sp. NPDC004532]|uniref:hypothetical protein n=1 Tax=Streptomyces sp. NPDC091299 TaxID=3155302 RepID=UPI00343974FB
MSHTSAEEARLRGRAECAQRAQEIRERLSDVRGPARAPTRAGFETSGGRTFCLGPRAHGPVYGPLGDRGRQGMAFADTADMR